MALGSVCVKARASTADTSLSSAATTNARSTGTSSVFPSTNVVYASTAGSVREATGWGRGCGAAINVSVTSTVVPRTTVASRVRMRMIVLHSSSGISVRALLHHWRSAASPDPVVGAMPRRRMSRPQRLSRCVTALTAKEWPALGRCRSAEDDRSEHPGPAKEWMHHVSHTGLPVLALAFPAGSAVFRLQGDTHVYLPCIAPDGETDTITNTSLIQLARQAGDAGDGRALDCRCSRGSSSGSQGELRSAVPAVSTSIRCRPSA